MLTYRELFAYMRVGKSFGHTNLIRHPERPDETDFVPGTDDMVHRITPVPIGERAVRIDERDRDQMREEYLALRDKRAAEATERAARAAANPETVTA
jgi:hypothetical protein